MPNDTSDGREAGSWFHDDLLAWLCPGGLLLTALAIRYPDSLTTLRAIAPELTLPTWFAGAYVLGLALSPLGRMVYALTQAIVWPRLRTAWTPAIAFLAERLCSLSCNSAAACFVFAAIDCAVGRGDEWTSEAILTWSACTALALIAATYRERRRQRTQLSIWRRIGAAD